LTIPLELSNPAVASVALEAAECCAGGWDASASADGLRLKLQMPGNVRALMDRLRAAGIPTPDRIDVVVPVRSMGCDVPPDIEHLLANLHNSGEVYDARVEGDNLVASTGPTSRGLYRIYHSLIHEGLMPQDTPTLSALRGL